MKKLTMVLTMMLVIAAAVFAKPVAVNKTLEDKSNGAVLTWVSTDTDVDSYNFTMELSTKNWYEPEQFASWFDIAEYEENTVYTFSLTSPAKNVTLSFVLDGDTYRVALK
jgi:hypothetical protein